MMLLRWRSDVHLLRTPVLVRSSEGLSVPISSQAANAWAPLQDPARDVAIPNLQTGQVPANEPPSARFLIEVPVPQPSLKPSEPNVYEALPRRYGRLSQMKTKWM